MKDFAEQTFDNLDAEFFTGERRERSDANESPFKPANVSPDAIGQEIDDIIWQFDAHELRLLVKDGEAHFDIGRLQIGNEAPLEARDKTMFEILNFARR